MGNSRRARTAGIIGYPLKHSLSPAFQQAAFDYYCLPVRYEAWETPPEGLPEVVSGLRDGRCIGANVTVPHKETVMQLLDEVDDLAQEIGAVNTIVNRDGKLCGFNTDAEGFDRSLEEEGYAVAEKVAVVLGAGGAARAVGFALARRGAKGVTFVNRDVTRAQRLVEDLGSLEPECDVTYAGYDESDLENALRECDLIVNATVVGMKHGAAENRSPLPANLIPSEALVFDLVYNPPVTRLLREASERGARTVRGVSMLVYQGAASFQLWTGNRAPVGLMFERVMEALRS